MGRHKVRRIFAELEAAGYLKKSEPLRSGGRFATSSITVFGSPRIGQSLEIVKDSTVSDFRNTVSRDGKPGNGEGQYKRNKEKKQNTNEERGEKRKRFVPPTQQQVEDHMLTKGADFDQARNWAEDFVDFYASKDWMVGKNKMKSWTHAASRWAKQNREKSNDNRGQHKNSGSFRQTATIDF